MNIRLSSKINDFFAVADIDGTSKAKQSLDPVQSAGMKLQALY